MPFNSLKYFLFLPLVYAVFYIVGERARWCILLGASILFYAALNVPYLLFVLVFVALISYSFGIWLEQAETVMAKRALLWGGIALNVLILVVMKYLPFLSENVNVLSTSLSLDVQFQPVKVFVAIGVSYYVFQAISYLIDIYLELEKPERHFGYFALYLSFFPKLLQGPIERAGDLIPQLKTKYEFNYDNMRFGMLLFTWGLFKKVVVADRLGLYVDAVYNDIHAFAGLPLLLSTYAYAFQIFFDFSGYTDMALGSAKLFNINLTPNFNSPYLATSVADFWRRWHISFSRWILDYIFKPLQMQWRNWKNLGTATALVVAFLVSGVWHGASWGFIIWGGLHGVYLACSVFYKPYQKKLHKALGIDKSKILKYWQIIITFNLVSFAWIFFRANNLNDAMYLVTNLFTYRQTFLNEFFLTHGRYQLTVVSLTLFIYLTIYFGMRSEKNIRNFNLSASMRWVVYSSLLLILLLFYQDSSSEFIYFKF